MLALALLKTLLSELESNDKQIKSIIDYLLSFGVSAYELSPSTFCPTVGSVRLSKDCVNQVRLPSIHRSIPHPSSLPLFQPSFHLIHELFLLSHLQTTRHTSL